MNLVALVLIASAIVFLYLCVVWKKDDWVNVSFKLLFAVMAIANVIAALYQLGWMIQIPG